VRAEQPGLVGRMVIDRGAQGEGVENPNTRLWPLGAALKGRPFQAMLVEFTQTDLATFGDWNRHDTDDLLHVLSGTLVLHTEGYALTTLHPGDTVQFDGAMPHACLTGGPETCRCLYVFAPR
jgi:quercetin dioxygenase-like cupin family protein